MHRCKVVFLCIVKGIFHHHDMGAFLPYHALFAYQLPTGFKLRLDKANRLAACLQKLL